jgi:hypothetical protein
MEQRKAGIDGIVVVMDLILDIGTDIAAALEDKKLSLPETIALSKHIPGAIGAIKAAPDLPAELADLDDEERAQIIAHFAERFSLPSAEMEQRVERLFGVAVNFGEQIVETVELVKEFRAKE